jgi:hypothetical protein
MRHVTRFLIRLYPATWRARYGEEFETLLEDSSPSWTAIFDLLKGAIKMQLFVPAFPKLALVLSVMGLFGGLAISFAVTPRYVSIAVMTLGNSLASPAPSEVRRDLVEYLMQTENEILSRTSLSSVINDPRLDLYPRERAGTPLEDVIEKMRKKDILIRIETLGSNYLSFGVTFTYPDRFKAQRTVQALVTKFSDSNQSRQRSQARSKRANTSDQVYRLEERIAALEKRLGMPSTPHEPDFSPNTPGGINLEVLDPPSLPVQPVFPDRVRFMAVGFGAGVVGAVVIAVFRRRPPAIPFPAQNV